MAKTHLNILATDESHTGTSSTTTTTVTLETHASGGASPPECIVCVYATDHSSSSGVQLLKGKREVARFDKVEYSEIGGRVLRIGQDWCRRQNIGGEETLVLDFEEREVARLDVTGEPPRWIVNRGEGGEELWKAVACVVLLR